MPLYSRKNLESPLDGPFRIGYVPAPSSLPSARLKERYPQLVGSAKLALPRKCNYQLPTTNARVIFPIT